MTHPRETLIFAHRGASLDAPENTMEAFVLAHKMGADGIELDARFTADGELVLLHNDTVDATSDGHGAISSMTLAEAKRLDFSHGISGYKGARIPTLNEALDWASSTRVFINIELKIDPSIPPDHAIARRVLEMVALHRMEDRVILSCFNHEALLEAKRIAPSVQVGALYNSAPYEPYRYARDNGFEAVHPHFSSFSLPEDIQMFHSYCIAVRPFTVDNPVDLTALMRAGADAVITNAPDRAISIRSSL